MGVFVRRSAMRAVLPAFLLLALPAILWAQAGTATVTGTVRDTQGAVLPGATITITQTSTGAVRSTVTKGLSLTPKELQGFMPTRTAVVTM